MNLDKKPSKYACKVAGFISLVHTATGLLLVGGFVTGLFHEEKKKKSKSRDLRAEVLQANRGDPSARARVES